MDRVLKAKYSKRVNEYRRGQSTSVAVSRVTKLPSGKVASRAMRARKLRDGGNNDA